MQVVDAVSSREPLVQRLEVANSLMLTFHGLRNANVRDGDTRLRLTMSAQVAAQLWRKLGEELTEAEENRLSSASSCQCWASDAQDDLGGTFHQRCEERLGPAVAWRMARRHQSSHDGQRAINGGFRIEVKRDTGRVDIRFEEELPSSRRL